ncbi:prepilin peptidase [Leuconostoc suionicum]|uniref:prepilin peptidase n=1 Tax=Leuconostoc suionicum TaxID=1511761 RepID=UPI0032DFAC20
MENIFIFLFNSIIVSSTICTADRLSNSVSLKIQRSFCFYCGHNLAWFDIIPVISACILHNKCRYCHASFGRYYAILELFYILIGTILWGTPVTWLTGVLLLFLSLEDCSKQRIHSNILFPWIGYLLVLHHDAEHLCLTVLILILSIILVKHRHALGSGDIPVLLSLILSTTPVIFSCTLLIGCCLALLYLLYSQQKRLPFVPFLSGGWVITNLYILFLL